MKIKTIIEILKEVETTKFDFHGNIGSLSAFSSKKDYYWDIMLNQKFHEEKRYTFVEVQFQLRIGEKEYYLAGNEVSFDGLNGTLDKYLEYAKELFIERFSAITIK